MPIWKQLVVLLMLAALGLGGYDAYKRYLVEPPADETRRGARAVAVETAAAELRVLPRTVEAVGTTRARQSVEIVPPASGFVVENAMRPGKRVAAGEVLVRLDDDIERANLVEAEAQLVEQELAVDRAERLQASNAIARATLEQVTAAKAAADAAVERARRRLADRVIRSPFAGVVGLNDIDIGARVDDKSVLTTLDDLTEVEIEFSLPEMLFADIRAGLAISARSAAFPDRSFDGRVASIDSRIDPVSRAFRVRAVVPNPEGVLPSGMFMFLTLTLSETEAVVVPEEAIIVQAAETYVFTLDGTRATRRTVVTGQRRDGAVAILSGLAPGEAVVTRGTQRLRDGSEVKILGEPATAASSTGNGT